MQMGTVFALLLAITAVEHFLRVPILREEKKLLAIGQKFIRVLRSRRISDHWKERALICYAQGTMKSTLMGSLGYAIIDCLRYLRLC